jgi:hypothetical protein
MLDWQDDIELKGAEHFQPEPYSMVKLIKQNTY